MKTEEKKKEVYNILVSNTDGDISEDAKEKFNESIDSILKIPFESILCKYYKDNEYLEYDLHMENGSVVSIGYFGKDEEVDYCICTDGEPLTLEMYNKIEDAISD